MSVLAFDTETHLIEPGLLAPPLVCVQWQRQGSTPDIRHRVNAYDIIRSWLLGSDRLIGHNVAYDMAVIAAQWPDLLPLIFAKYDRDEVTDTQIREQLVMISRGTFRSAPDASGEWRTLKYSLADSVFRHFGVRLLKDGWRLFYRVFDDHPRIGNWPSVAAMFQAAPVLPDWAKDIDPKDVQAMRTSSPDEPVRYALDDPRWTLSLYEAQEAYAAKDGRSLFTDQFRQARAAFGLHLSSCWGVHTDPEAVEKLATTLQGNFDSLVFELQQAGIIREDGTADTRVAKDFMLTACAEENVPPIMTKKGAVSMGAEACGRFTDDDGNPLDDVGESAQIVGSYSRFLTLRKTLSNDIKMLRAGEYVPLQPRYDMTDTGRTRASKPPIQAINRGAGIRETIRPRLGTVFIQADYEGLELHTLAVWCLENVGWSKLADALNAGMDVHLAMAADLLGITYEAALERKKAGDKEIKEYRQRAKALNFGLPGGLGAQKFVRYAKTSYGVTLTLDEAKTYKSAWLRRFPEMNEFFRLAAIAVNNPSQVGDETHIFTGRVRGNVRYSALCNGRFQGLGADAAKEATWLVTKACYDAGMQSPLYGCRVVAMVHDELILECPEERCHEAAQELGRLMKEGANKYLSKVPVRLEPLAMRLWSKNAEPVYNDNGRLIAWESKAA